MSKTSKGGAGASKAALSGEQMQKKFKEHNHNLPVQLSLFFLEDKEDESRYSQSIEFYDAIPKYVSGDIKRIADVYLPAVTRNFEFRSKMFKVIISPASIVDKDNVEKYYYPSERTEIVEDALRKLMVEGKGIFLDNEAGVFFTLYALEQELANTGHKISKQELKLQLKILAKSNIEVVDESGKTECVFHPIETLGLKGEDDETQTFAKFPPLVTRSIKENTYRRFNYDVVMSYQNLIARRLHKRLSHFYIQANLATKYQISLTTLVRDMAITDNSGLPALLQRVEKALKLMVEKDVILLYDIEKKYQRGRGRYGTLLDAVITIVTSQSFNNEMRISNALKKQARELLLQAASNTDS